MRNYLAEDLISEDTKNEYCPLRNTPKSDSLEPEINHNSYYMGRKREHTESDDDTLTSSSEDHTSDRSEDGGTDYCMIPCIC